MLSELSTVPTYSVTHETAGAGQLSIPPLPEEIRDALKCAMPPPTSQHIWMFRSLMSSIRSTQFSFCYYCYTYLTCNTGLTYCWLKNDNHSCRSCNTTRLGLVPTGVFLAMASDSVRTRFVSVYQAGQSITLRSYYTFAPHDVLAKV